MGNVVYVETSVISYLAARPSRDIIIARHQQTTQDWWASERTSFSVYASPLVFREASAGDPAAAIARLQWLRDIPLLAITPEAEQVPTETLAPAINPSLSRCGRCTLRQWSEQLRQIAPSVRVRWGVPAVPPYPKIRQ